MGVCFRCGKDVDGSLRRQYRNLTLCGEHIHLGDNDCTTYYKLTTSSS